MFRLIGGAQSAARRLMRAVTVALGFAVVGVGVAEAQDACRVYSRASLNGFILDLGDGESAGRLNFFLDRDVSSVSVAPGCRVTLYSGREFSGRDRVFRESATHLPSGWNNTARSVSCECGRRGRRDDRADDRRGGRRGGDDADFDRRDFDGRAVGRGEPPRLRRRGAACIAFEDRRYRGRWRSFARGDVGERFGRRLRGRVSSVQVADGCRAVLDFGRSYRLVVTESVRRLPRAVEDAAVEFSCRCGR